MNPSVLILIAEDDAGIRVVLETAFEEGGFDVLTASNGEEAMAILDARDDVRALLTDVDLGSEILGWDLARHGRELNADLPVVYMTGRDSQEWATLGVPNSILITKPFAPAQAITAISQLLNAGNPAPA